MKTLQQSIGILALAWLLTACSTLADATLGVVEGTTIAPTATAWPEFPPDTCPVTQPPAEPFVPPPPYGPYPYDGRSWYGTAGLWTDIPDDGRWHGLPYSTGKGYTQKVVFWNEDYDWQTNPQPNLRLTGRRLDGDAPSIDTDHATNGYHPDFGSFILTGLAIPTPGCWELSAVYEGVELRFVVWVTP